MNPEEMHLPASKAGDFQMRHIDPAFMTDPYEIHIIPIIPDEHRQDFIRYTLEYQAKRADLESQIDTARADMLRSQAALLGKC